MKRADLSTAANKTSYVHSPASAERKDIMYIITCIYEC